MKLGMLLGQFDPFTLVSLIAGNITNGAGWPFFVKADDGWTRARINSLLSAKGIKTWGWGVTVNNQHMFSVALGQAHFAEQLGRHTNAADV